VSVPRGQILNLVYTYYYVIFGIKQHLIILFLRNRENKAERTFYRSAFLEKIDNFKMKHKIFKCCIYQIMIYMNTY